MPPQQWQSHLFVLAPLIMSGTPARTHAAAKLQLHKRLAHVQQSGYRVFGPVERDNEMMVERIKNLSWPENEMPAAEDWMRQSAWHTNIKGWFLRAGYDFDSWPTGSYTNDRTGDVYEVGLIRIITVQVPFEISRLEHFFADEEVKKHMRLLKYYICRPEYDGASMKIQGYGEIYSEQNKEFPEMCEGQFVGVEEFPNEQTGEWVRKVVTVPQGPDLSVHYGKYWCAKKLKDANRHGVSEASIDIIYTHPETGEKLEYPEWEIAQSEHFQRVQADWVRSVPSFISDRVITDAASNVENAINSELHTMGIITEEGEDADNVEVGTGGIDDAVDVRAELEDAAGKWGRPEITLKDDYPLCWVYSGTNEIDTADVYRLFRSSGLRFDLESGSIGSWI